MENNAVNNVAVDLQNGTAAAPATEPQTLADVIGASPEPVQQQAPAPEGQPAPEQQQEPGWFQGRLQKERAKWEAERQSEMATMIERQNALLERLIVLDAQDLVNSGEFKSLDRAIEYRRMQEGLPVNQQPAQPVSTQARDAQGRFVAPQPQQPGPDQAAQQRAQVLVDQADVIQRATGVDVMNIYKTNPEVKQKVITGVWDFADVLKNHGGLQQPAAPNPHVPAPVRSSNGVDLGNVSVRKMSSQEFARLNDFLDKNGKVNMS